METLRANIQCMPANIKKLAQISHAPKRPAPGALQNTEVLLYTCGSKPNSFSQYNSGQADQKLKNYRFRN